jgi:hypothetical protein
VEGKINKRMLPENMSRQIRKTLTSNCISTASKQKTATKIVMKLKGFKNGISLDI